MNFGRAVMQVDVPRVAWALTGSLRALRAELVEVSTRTGR
jgi:hypothetical protein